jgi:hypothetical protein
VLISWCRLETATPWNAIIITYYYMATAAPSP